METERQYLGMYEYAVDIRKRLGIIQEIEFYKVKEIGHFEPLLIMKDKEVELFLSWLGVDADAVNKDK